MELNELVYIDQTGYHFPDYPTVLDWYQKKYRGIYGEDVYLGADSQDGQWIAINAKATFDMMALGENIYLSFSPANAQGAGLARAVKINGIKKQIATKSTVDLLLVGQVGSNILNGVAQDTLQQKWDLPSPVVFPPEGEITVTATAQDDGAISALPNTITQIFTPTLGWQTVTNLSSATEGDPVESDGELRIRQTTSVALPSLTVFEGTIGAVQNVPGVSRVKGYENDSDTTDADGVPEHSISLIVEGGDVQEIADAIARKKTPGTGTYGTTSQVTYDKYGMPNTINFFRPTIQAIKVKIIIFAFGGYSSSYATLIKNAVAAEINKLTIGGDVLITKLFVPANLPGTSAGETFDITSIQIAKVANALGTINIPILFNEAASCDIADIEIEVVS